MEDESFIKFLANNLPLWISTIIIIFSVLVLSPIMVNDTSQTSIEITSIDNSNNPSLSGTDNLRLKKEKPLRLGRKMAERLYHPIIVQAARLYDVDLALIKAIIMAESGYNPMAISKSGARGLMQLMPGTAEDLGVRDSFNPEHNIHGGVKYFKWLLKRCNDDVKLALAAYNAGFGRVKKHKIVPIPRATQCYVKKVFQYYHHYKKEIEA